MKDGLERRLERLGATYEKALASARKAARLWIDTAKELGRAVPEPKGRRLMFA